MAVIEPIGNVYHTPGILRWKETRFQDHQKPLEQLREELRKQERLVSPSGQVSIAST